MLEEQQPVADRAIGTFRDELLLERPGLAVADPAEPLGFDLRPAALVPFHGGTIAGSPYATTSATACAIARRCGGVLPQQAPMTFAPASI